MPRGGHFGLWKPTPKDIFKSRWKRFYKRCYRPRSAGNAVDRPPPHDQAMLPNDGVPSPWRLHFSSRNFDTGLPSDARRSAKRAYDSNVGAYMNPSVSCNSPALRDVVLRCLDRGRRGVSDSGIGRVETATWADEPPSHVPAHVYNIIKEEAALSEESRQFLDVLKGPDTKSETFAVRRLYELCEEWELVWEGGLNDPRKPPPLRALPDGSAQVKDRGRFPFVDEQASLIDDLGLREILRLAHRTSSRRHPKWREAVYWYKKRHSQYLRRKAMAEDEVKQRMGLLKASLGET
mmetsp:Transcript_96464/g.287896  ORF Transcript_96464/g.287896 Transcript_96464/m.287896 type:complete len:292 (-) Transcript_96464:130-1005(-)